MDSFWKNNPCSPSWSKSLESWWSSTPPQLAEPGRHPLLEKRVSGCSIQIATLEMCPAVQEFWMRYFSISTKCRCVVPLTHIQACVRDQTWQIFCILSPQQTLVGTCVRRWIKGLHIGPAVWQKGGMIDYFCVHPAWRKK